MNWNVYRGQGAPTGVLSHWQIKLGWTRQRLWGVLIGDCFIGITRWYRDAPSAQEKP